MYSLFLSKPRARFPQIAVELGARGSTRIQSLPAIPVGDFLDALSEARGQ